MNFFAQAAKSYVSKQIVLLGYANSVVCPCKFRRACIQIPSCAHANSVVRPYKFRCAPMQMSGKDNLISVFSRAAIFVHFGAKIA